MYGLKDYK